MQLNVLDYFENGALAHTPDKIAVVDGDDEYSFRELELRSKDFAQLIFNKVTTFRRPIAVFLPKCVWTIVADLGILYSGNFYTNLDLKSPPDRLKNILKTVDPILIVTISTFRESLLALGVDDEMILCIEPAVTDIHQHDNRNFLSRRELIIDTDPVCIINTSGSTGVPKSVVMNHRSIIDFIDWCTNRFIFTDEDVIGSLSPFYFDIYTLELYVALARGSTITIIPEQLAAFPARLVQFLASNQISFLFWVPTIMVNIANMDLLNAANVSSIRRVFFAGEVFPTKHLNYWRRHLPLAEFVNLYGPIEITVDCTYFVIDRDFADYEPIPIGHPCRNTDVLILNEHNQLVDEGEQGELCVRGSSLALGYYNNPEQTAKVFIQNPLNQSFPELIYRTGDLVYRNELGEIMFVGRKDNQIKHLGYRIELSEIETAVLAIPEIRNACVLYQHTNKEITLYFESDTELTPSNIRINLVDRIPKYMLPTVFHQLKTMPLNPNGKIDRNTLALQSLNETKKGNAV
jgi:D-alanine--poly(phosphoribitol) ligase subunit 1